MKNILVTICGLAVAFAGCKEHGTAIDFGGNALPQTTYVVSPVPVSNPHQILVEEFTGQGCTNCPEGHVDLDKISSQNPGRINVISMYGDFSPESVPPGGSVNDFRDAAAVNILLGIYGSKSPIPCAGIDRSVNAVNGNLMQVGSSSWDGFILAQLGITDSVNLSVKSSYDPSKKLATITALVTYTQPLSTQQNLSIVVVEDSIYDKQESFDTSPITLDHYLFLDVFRGMVTSVPAGDKLSIDGASDIKEAGRSFNKVYAYALPVKSPAIIPSHCRVIAFVNNAIGADKRVLQSAQCKLAP